MPPSRRAAPLDIPQRLVILLQLPIAHPLSSRCAKSCIRAVPTSLFTSVRAPDEGPRKREPDVKWFFQPRPDGDGATHDEDDSAPGLISLPAELLQRHGAVVLDPGKAAAVNGYPTPQSTVYRVRTLLVPGDQLQDSQLVTALNGVLRGVRMTLIPPEPDDEMAGDGDVMEVLRQLPRPAVLVPARALPSPWWSTRGWRCRRCAQRPPRSAGASGASGDHQGDRPADRARASDVRLGHHRQPDRRRRRWHPRRAGQQQRRRRSQQHRLLPVQRRRHADPGRGGHGAARPQVSQPMRVRLRPACRGRAAGHGRPGTRRVAGRSGEAGWRLQDHRRRLCRGRSQPAACHPRRRRACGLSR